MQMVIETTVNDGEPVTEALSFSYDASGMPMAVIYNGTAYFYTVNLQGDVMAIVDATGTAVVSYAYDAWGNILSVTGTMADTLGESNPLRYRGYVYDPETDLYYLQSRYYDPELGRFINADAFTSTGQGILGNNMFAYCGNNPANRVDPTGHAFMQMRFDPDGASDLLTPGPWGGGSGGVGYAGSVYSSAKSSMLQQTNELIYKNQGDTAQIVDSYTIRNPIVMYVYIDEHKGDVIGGTTTGAVVEWIVHNLAYDAGYVLKTLGFTDFGQKTMDQGGSVDIGSTIYDDEHPVAAQLMWIVYFGVAPLPATIDIVVEIFEQEK